MPRKRPFGVTVLGVGFIATSLLQLTALLDLRHYRYLFQNWPGEFLLLRFAASWVMRILGIAAGLGLLAQDERARKAVLGLSWFTILTVYWKHPYDGFLRHVRYVNDMLDGLLEQLRISLPSLALWSCITTMVFEVACASVVLYYLTRPRIKAHFATPKR
ncbi:MAG: hypothetical protein HY598_02965 [Candidatus Omnitrophica bacterium]|nr:hypothetical protein [Candidatus Omnitrophota bacterium]